jgi:hypothetical protein
LPQKNEANAGAEPTQGQRSEGGKDLGLEIAKEAAACRLVRRFRVGRFGREPIRQFLRFKLQLGSHQAQNVAPSEPVGPWNKSVEPVVMAVLLSFFALNTELMLCTW